MKLSLESFILTVVCLLLLSISTTAADDNIVAPEVTIVEIHSQGELAEMLKNISLTETNVAYLLIPVSMDSLSHTNLPNVNSSVTGSSQDATNESVGSCGCSGRTLNGPFYDYKYYCCRHCTNKGGQVLQDTSKRGSDSECLYPALCTTKYPNRHLSGCCKLSKVSDKCTCDKETYTCSDGTGVC